MNKQVIITCNAELQYKQAIIYLLIDDAFRRQAGYCKAIRENREMLYIIFNYNGSHAELVVKLARQIQ